VPGVALRPVEDSDLDALFDQMRDPESVWMAAFTAGDPSDRGAFDAHMDRLRNSPGISLRAVTCDGRSQPASPALSCTARPRPRTGSIARPGTGA
jgi:hypothetical protein